QPGGEFGALPGDVAFVAPQWEIGTVIRRELDHLRKRLSPGKVIFAWVPPGVLAHGRSFFHRGAEELTAVSVMPSLATMSDHSAAGAYAVVSALEQAKITVQLACNYWS